MDEDVTMRDGIFRQSYIIMALWTLIKVVNVFQINLWLQSIGIERSLWQVVQAQGLSLKIIHGFHDGRSNPSWTEMIFHGQSLTNLEVLKVRLQSSLK